MPVDAKICGLTRPADAALAVEHGAARLGVVFASGPRVVTAERALDIVQAADGVPVFGVFGTQPVGTILKVAAIAGLSGVQLHGNYDVEAARQLSAVGLEVWTVLPLTAGMDLRRAMAERATGADAVLVESGAGESGGKGIPIPLELARLARDAAPNIRFVLAGGLTPETVGDAIRFVRPDVVDVSSGVELSPGIKDPARLKHFLENVRDANSAA